MFNKILVANRGEIALRIIRACRELGIKTVAVFSEADKNELHVRFADEAYCIGPPRASDSYLNMNNIISAAKIAGADAIHPGYGFLAENSYFARLCKQNGLTFIGPRPDAMDLMGSKIGARSLIVRKGVPVIPGSRVLTDLEMALQEAKRIGFPVMLKASAGGGGRGMRIVRSEEELSRAYPSARNEAKNAFGNDEIYLEKYLTNPRHIEFQIAGDKYGNIVCHGERDCSIQRRNQKLTEEAPCYSLDNDLRRTMGETSVKVAELVNYDSVGTVEFLLDNKGNFYFIEMNTRIQVEHPVTEIVTGIDLVQEQIRIAAGERLDPTDTAFNCIGGHAIEFRICAEDPRKEFAPCSGIVSNFLLPGGPGVRVDTALYEGCRVSPHYDSLLAKLIVWGPTREKAIKTAERALGEFIISGIPTTIPFHRKVITNGQFISGKIGTNFIDNLLKPDLVQEV